MQISSQEMKPGESITVSILVENIGTRDGEEVVQLYIRDYFASMVRPVKELKGYQKITMKAGEKERVTFTVTEETLKFYDAKGKFTAEPGKFAIMIGNSSVQTEQKDILYIN